MPSSVQIVWKNHKMGEVAITVIKITDSKNEIMREWLLREHSMNDGWRLQTVVATFKSTARPHYSE
jgi:hypothetical protein